MSKEPKPDIQPKTRVMREISPEWDEIIRVTESLANGEVIIKVHQHEISLTDYHVRRKPKVDTDDFDITQLN
ncbi:hypothetical protein HY504_02715 [Candidatus Wolfebacteria bacterium]|nr:hypothetical protein [Candidatus Wolfebacteria bacterium]